MRTATIVSIAMLLHASAFAEDSGYVMNFDLNTLSPDGSIGYTINLQGIHLLPERPFHDELGKYDYFLTISKAESGKAKLTIEFYEYESRRKTADVISEIVSEVDVTLGIPARFEDATDTFGIDLAFNISQE